MVTGEGLVRQNLINCLQIMGGDYRTKNTLVFVTS